MKQFFKDIKARLEEITVVKNGGTVPIHVRMWNNQVELVDKGRLELFACPACFIGFVASEVMQLGENVQLIDPLLVQVHIIHWQVDAGDGTFEQNLDVFDFRMDVWKKLQKFVGTKAGAMIRISEVPDYTHAGVYHWIQTYRCNLTEDEVQEPIDGIDWDPVPMPVEISLTTQDKQDKATPYDATIQYLAANNTYVSQLGVIYVCSTDTPNPAGVFDITKWTVIEPNTYSFTPS